MRHVDMSRDDLVVHVQVLGFCRDLVHVHLVECADAEYLCETGLEHGVDCVVQLCCTRQCDKKRGKTRGKKRRREEEKKRRRRKEEKKKRKKEEKRREKKKRENKGER